MTVFLIFSPTFNIITLISNIAILLLTISPYFFHPHPNFEHCHPIFFLHSGPIFNAVTLFLSTSPIVWHPLTLLWHSVITPIQVPPLLRFINSLWHASLMAPLRSVALSPSSHQGHYVHCLCLWGSCYHLKGSDCVPAFLWHLSTLPSTPLLSPSTTLFSPPSFYLFYV